MKKFALLLLLVFVVLFPSASLLSQSVINFDDQGWNSNQLLSSSFATGGLTFTSAKTSCTNFGYNLNVNNISVYFIFENTTTDQLIIQTTNSALVNFNSIAAYQVSQGGSDTLIVEGWNGTTMQYSQKFAKINSWQTLTLNFQNVNKLILKSGNKNAGLYDYNFDNVSYSPAVTIANTVLIMNATSAALSGDARFGTMTGQRSTRSIYFRGTKGGATFSINVPKTGQWYAWARMYYKSSGGKNAFYLTSNGNKFILGDNNSRYDQWNWDGYIGVKISLGSLTAGTNKILISGKETGTTLWVDQLLLTDDPNFVPTDANTAGSSVILAGANSGTLSGDARLGTMTGQKSSRSVYFVGTSGGTTLKVSVPKAGNYYAWARMYYMSSGGKNSFYLTVNGKQYILGDNDNKYNQWHWDGYSGSKIDLGTLAAGTSTVKISGREPGTTLWVDQLVITDDPNYNPNTTLGKEDVTDEEITEQILPEEYTLDQNYPNPFNPTTTIRYNIPSGDMVKLVIYDILGNEVSVMINEFQEAGQYEVNFNASSLASGVYYYALKTNGFNQVKKMLLLK